MKKTHESRITFRVTENDGTVFERRMDTKHKSLELAQRYIAGFVRNHTGRIIATDIVEL